MEKEKIAELFMKGIDCSQVVAGAFAEELGITQEEAYKMAAGFGGGMGIGETCGAVVGAMIVLGMKYGHFDTEHMEQKEIMNAKRAEFLEKFGKYLRNSVRLYLPEGNYRAQWQYLSLVLQNNG